MRALQSNTTILKVKYDHQEKFDSKTSQKIRFVIVKVKSWMGATRKDYLYLHSTVDKNSLKMCNYKLGKNSKPIFP